MNFIIEYDCTPTMYAVRSFDYNYVYSACDSVVEEFYDLINDPKENINKINYASLQDLIQTYRYKLDTLRQFYGDTILTDTIINCGLLNNIATRIENESDDEPESGILYASVFPNPGHDLITVSWSFLYTKETEVLITDITGRQVFFNTYRNDSNRNISIDSENWQINMNQKKLRRLYREEKLQVRRRGGRKRALGRRRPMLVPDRANIRWSLDFVSDALTDRPPLPRSGGRG